MADPRGASGETELTERVLVRWEGGRRYRGGREGAPHVLLDGERLAGPGPVDSVLLALAACSGIDVVDILEKRRTPALALGVEVRFARAGEPPRSVTRAHLLFRVRTASAPHHVERAVKLSRDRYCSVSASLAPGIPITHEVEVEEP